MDLVLNEVLFKKTNTQRKLENMGTQFVLVTIKLDTPVSDKNYINERPRHWRIGDGKNPPFDISLFNKNIISEITFFIADNKLKNEEKQSEYEIESGIPVFEGNIWSEENFYLDNEGNVEMIFFDQSIYCMFAKEQAIKIVKIDDKTGCLFDKKSNLIGVGIMNLNEEEIRILKETNLI